MNLIPLVMIFLFLFALVSNTIRENSRFFNIRHKEMYKMYMTQRAARNEREQSIKDRHSSKSNSLKSGHTQKDADLSKQKIIDFQKIRTQFHASGRIGLSFLQKSDPKAKSAIFAILQTLYGHLPECQNTPLLEDLQKHFLRASKALEQTQTPLSFASLIPDKKNKPLYALYHKLLQGTLPYTCQKNIDFPSLTQVFAVDGKDQIPFQRVHHSILKALFGDKAAAILQEEQQKNKFLSQKEIEPLLQGTQALENLGLCDFTNPKKEKAVHVNEYGLDVQLKI